MKSMSFHIGFNEIVLFEQWKITSLTGTLCSVIAIIILAIIYEGVKNFRERLFFNVNKSKNRGPRKTKMELLTSRIHLYQTLLHVVQGILGYFLMLIFMTYNVWLCIGLMCGTGLGYWIFSWDKSNAEALDCC